MSTPAPSGTSNKSNLRYGKLGSKLDLRRANTGVRPFPSSLGGTTKKFVGIECDAPKK